ncbi:cilium assembly protein DZIP1L isoform X1 [Monodelphis domestica]|uniref:cilium assembly protein DZIP1L isoform X1 n=1 Tax=Monodelphis domestica TaxID=13616 RepID=UPI0024E25EBD|nr:cilium assembly protein DZIP1L isoform X1 [Monodelphis domestica]
MRRASYSLVAWFLGNLEQLELALFSVSPCKKNSEEARCEAELFYLSPLIRNHQFLMPGLSASVEYLANEGGFRRMFPGTYGTSAFKFQPRRESVDWRRLSAIDVDRVAQELDVTTLQDHITGVTYCNLDSERCAYCQQPVDPVLLKVLKMAQLIIEYLLHSQDYLSANIISLEEKLQSTLEQQEQTKQKLDKQAEELKGVKEESRRRKKMLSMQQLLIQAGANNYHKCHLCDKAFMNNSYLQGHIQRRHAEVKQSERQKQQMQQMEDGIEELKAKLKGTQAQLEAEREAERQRQMQEAENIHLREIEAKKELEKWKEEERKKLYQEIDNLKQLLLNEFKSVTSQNSILEEKLQALQTHTVVESFLGTLKDDDSEDRQKQAKEVQDMKEKLEHQKLTWKRKLKDLQEEHLAEKKRLKDENERLRVSLSQDQRKAADHFQRQMDSLSAKCQEQANIIKSQEEMIKRMTFREEEVIHQIAKAEETEDSTQEELEDSLDGKQKVLEVLRRNPNLLKQFRPILEDTLEEKLESIGLKRGTKGISDQTYRNLEVMLKAHREQKSKRFSEFLKLRDKLIKEVAQKIGQRQQNDSMLLQPVNMGTVKSQRSPLPRREVQQKSKTLRVESQLQQTASPMPQTPQSQVNHSPAPPVIPVPTPRSKVPGPPGARASPGPGLSTPPFTSEDDSEGDHISRPNLQAPSRVAVRDDNDWDWSDTETSDEKVPKPMESPGGVTSTGTRVQSLAKTLEKQLIAPGKKPAGGVSVFLASDVGPSKTTISVKKPQFSEDDSDLDISSLEEILQDLDVIEKKKKPQHLSRSQPVEKLGRISTDSQSISVWSSSSARVMGW